MGPGFRPIALLPCWTPTMTKVVGSSTPQTIMLSGPSAERVGKVRRLYLHERRPDHGNRRADPRRRAALIAGAEHGGRSDGRRLLPVTAAFCAPSDHVALSRRFARPFPPAARFPVSLPMAGRQRTWPGLHAIAKHDGRAASGVHRAWSSAMLRPAIRHHRVILIPPASPTHAHV